MLTLKPENPNPLKEFIINLEAELLVKLQSIEQESTDIIRQSKESMNISIDILNQLKKFVLKYRFKNKPEEIAFFKTIKPRFLSKLIYHHSVYHIETEKPVGNEKLVKKYLTEKISSIKKYFDKNVTFYSYYRTGSVYLDDKYFTRNQQDMLLHLDCKYFETDHRFSTTHDHKVARMIAHNDLLKYLENEVRLLSIKTVHNPFKALPKAALEWTESKSALVELIYALHYQGAVQPSAAGIKELAACFETVFSIDLGDYYRIYTDIKMRKTGRTKFLETLKDNLLKKMDESDSRY